MRHQGQHREFLNATLPHLGVVHNIARNLTGDPARAEDLVQETYLRAFKAFSGLRSDNTRSWLVAICLNVSRSEARRAQRRPVEQLGIDNLDSVATDSDVSADAFRAIDHERLRRALTVLPAEQRVALVMMDIAGMTADESALALGCPRGTVLSRTHRGRRRLAQLLAEEVVDEPR